MAAGGRVLCVGGECGLAIGAGGEQADAVDPAARITAALTRSPLGTCARASDPSCCSRTSLARPRCRALFTALNRAVAVGEVPGPAPALALVEDCSLDSSYPFHATRADLLRGLGRHAEAASEYERAAALAPTDAEREFLRRGGRALHPSSKRE